MLNSTTAGRNQKDWAAKRLKGWSAATQLIAGWGETCLFFLSLKPFFPLEVTYRRTPTVAAFPCIQARQKCSSGCCSSPWGRQWGDSGLEPAWPMLRDGSWGMPGAALAGSNPAAILSQNFAGLAQPSLRISLLSARPSPCQGCQLAWVTEPQPGGTGTEQITWSSSQLQDQWGGTQLCAGVVGDVSVVLSSSTGIFGYNNGSGLCQYLLLPSSTKMAQQPSSCRHPGWRKAGLPPGERQNIRIQGSTLLLVQQKLWHSSGVPQSWFLYAAVVWDLICVTSYLRGKLIEVHKSWRISHRAKRLLLAQPR